jgi:hypothetical protein
VSQPPTSEPIAKKTRFAIPPPAVSISRNCEGMEDLPNAKESKVHEGDEEPDRQQVVDRGHDAP